MFVDRTTKSWVLIGFILIFAGKVSDGFSGDFEKSVSSRNIELKMRLNQFDPERYNAVITQKDFPLEPGVQTIAAGDAEWKIELESSQSEAFPEAYNVTVHFLLEKGESRNSNLGLIFELGSWSEENYLLLPSAAYNGNRFASRRISYSPKLLDPRDIGKKIPTIISDVPRLNAGDGPSKMQLRTGDLATPAIGIQSPGTRQGLWITTRQGTKLGDTGITIEEFKNRNKAQFVLEAPVVRETHKYRITDNQFPSDDKPVHFKAGDSFTLTFELHFFPAETVQQLYDYFVNIRKIDSSRHSLVNSLPFSKAFEVQEKKFNEQNYVPEFGYYSVGMRENFLQDWQIGWTGGMISTYPLLFAGKDSTRQHVINNFNWLFPDGIAPSGFFWDSGEDGNKWYGGDIRKPHTKNWHLVRKSGDGLYYVLKQLMLMEKTGIPVQESWKTGTRKVADAFVKLWNEEGQFGQFVDNVTGEIQVGGSTSGAIVPAALMLAADYFKEDRYRQVAREAAEYYYQNYVSRGLTTGGPGDAMQNPDSESSYAMVESFITLFEHTGDKLWLERAGEMARQFSTWVISYDYKFPEESLFGGLDIRSTGAVFANTQNKHGAPGICTHSGVGLLKLFRATGDHFYLDLLMDIAHNMPQYLSHPSRPIPGAKSGWICERVNTTDWLEGIGEISYLSTWAETSLMLTTVEIPGIYVQPDQNLAVAFDNLEVEVLTGNKQEIKVKITNPTSLPASSRLLVEKQDELEKPLGENALHDVPMVHLKAGESKTMKFRKSR